VELVHVTTSLRQGGAERNIVNLVNGLAYKGIKQTIVLAFNGDIFFDGELNAEIKYPFPKINNRFLRFILVAGWLIHYVKSRDCKITCWMYWSCLIAIPLIPLKKSLVWSIRHAPTVQELSKSRYRACLSVLSFFSSYVTSILFNSECSRRVHVNVGFDDAKSVVLHNGFIKSGPSGGRFNSDSAIRASSKVVFGFVGRFHPDKGPFDFIKSALLVLQAGHPVAFLMAGSGVIEAQDEMRLLIPASQQSAFSFEGPQTNIGEIFSRIDIFCLTSRTESFPNVVGEAMMHGLPVIATDVGDTKLLVGEGSIIPPSDLIGIASAMIGFAKLPRSILHDKGQANRDYVIQRFSVERMVSRFLQILGID